MKIYLQDCKTLRFICCDSSWSSDLTEALDFISVRRATAYGLMELKYAFQLLQVDPDGVPCCLPAVIRQLPVINTITIRRPVGPARALYAAPKIHKRFQWLPSNGNPVVDRSRL